MGVGGLVAELRAELRARIARRRAAPPDRAVGARVLEAHRAVGLDGEEVAWELVRVAVEDLLPHDAGHHLAVDGEVGPVPVRQAQIAVAAERLVGAAHRALEVEEVGPVPVREGLAAVHAVLGRLRPRERREAAVDRRQPVELRRALAAVVRHHLLDRRADARALVRRQPARLLAHDDDLLERRLPPVAAGPLRRGAGAAASGGATTAAWWLPPTAAAARRLSRRLRHRRALAGRRRCGTLVAAARRGRFDAGAATHRDLSPIAVGGTEIRGTTATAARAHAARSTMFAAALAPLLLVLALPSSALRISPRALPDAYSMQFTAHAVHPRQRRRWRRRACRSRTRACPPTTWSPRRASSPSSRTRSTTHRCPTAS